MKHLIQRIFGRSRTTNETPTETISDSDHESYRPPEGALEFSRALLAMPRDEAARLRREYETRLREALS